MEIRIPEFSMVMMLGPTGSGKTTLARKHFIETEIISSDRCRAMVSDDPGDQQATERAFEVLHTILRARLAARRLAVVDSTNLRPEHRKTLQEIAREHDCQVTVIATDTPTGECLRRNADREDRRAEERVVRNHCRQMHQARRQIRRERFGRVHILTPEEAENVEITRSRMKTDRRDDQGPFDIIGDVHGCHDELMELLFKLGYHLRRSNRLLQEGFMTHPEGRRAIFLGDLCDRGPASDRVLDTAMKMVEAGSALCIVGNHDEKLARHLRGNKVQVSHGLERTISQLEQRSAGFRKLVETFLSGLPEHYLLDDGKLAVAHAGILEAYQGRASRRIREFCLYGQTTGESDEWGIPVRHDWAQEYRGRAMVVYGHTAVDEARWLNETICLDTGCVFGGALTALRYPERELVSVAARATHYEGVRPWAETVRTAREKQQQHGLLELRDVTGRLEIETETHGRIMIREEQARAALEPMSRFATDPRWLIYLPPTIYPGETSKLPGTLEHPAEVLRQYALDGMERVICEEKHMGSRGIVIAGRTPEDVRERFGIENAHGGACYSRTGRRFFNDDLEGEFLDRVREAVLASGLWEELGTNWLLLDCEIMPWNLKATGLIDHTYAPVGAAAANTLRRESELLERAGRRGVEVGELAGATLQRLEAVDRYREAYRRYCWQTDSLEGVRVAPFLALAGEQGIMGHDHDWHMSVGERLARQDPGLFQPTRHITVEPGNEAQEADAVQWWQELTREGGEGMVVKPLELVPRGKHDRIQPAVKVRGPEYLRIIYGPEYDLPGNLERMRGRHLSHKRNMALREFALGLEGLRRFCAGEPLHRVHQCAFAVAALESQPTDPRL